MQQAGVAIGIEAIAPCDGVGVGPRVVAVARGLLRSRLTRPGLLRGRQGGLPPLPTHRIEFLPGAVHATGSDATDFTGWAKQLPFSPVDAILANFAVINCIKDIDLLFSSFALALKPGGALIALVLRPGIRHELRSFAGLRTSTTDISYKGHRQTVYNHSMTGIRRAAGKRFHVSGRQSPDGSIFSLIHLTRK